MCRTRSPAGVPALSAHPSATRLAAPRQSTSPRRGARVQDRAALRALLRQTCRRLRGCWRRGRPWPARPTTRRAPCLAGPSACVCAAQRAAALHQAARQPGPAGARPAPGVPQAGRRRSQDRSGVNGEGMGAGAVRLEPSRSRGELSCSDGRTRRRRGRPSRFPMPSTPHPRPFSSSTRPSQPHPAPALPRACLGPGHFAGRALVSRGGC